MNCAAFPRPLLLLKKGKKDSTLSPAAHTRGTGPLPFLALSAYLIHRRDVRRRPCRCATSPPRHIPRLTCMNRATLRAHHSTGLPCLPALPYTAYRQRNAACGDPACRCLGDYPSSLLDSPLPGPSGCRLRAPSDFKLCSTPWWMNVGTGGRLAAACGTVGLEVLGGHHLFPTSLATCYTTPFNSSTLPPAASPSTRLPPMTCAAYFGTHGEEGSHRIFSSPCFPHTQEETSRPAIPHPYHLKIAWGSRRANSKHSTAGCCCTSTHHDLLPMP